MTLLSGLAPASVNLRSKIFTMALLELSDQEVPSLSSSIHAVPLKTMNLFVEVSKYALPAIADPVLLSAIMSIVAMIF